MSAIFLLFCIAVAATFYSLRRSATPTYVIAVVFLNFVISVLAIFINANGGA